VAELSGWQERPRSGGRGFGLACAVYNGTYVAEVAEVTVGESGEVAFQRAWCAVDCGTLIDADGARNQIEGGIVQGASWALLEELRHRNGSVAAATWDDYPIATFGTAPRTIEVAFTDDGRTAPTGLGEPGAVPIGAALANAVAAACGARVRTLPLRPERVLASSRVPSGSKESLTDPSAGS
jgi:CO/xanthine dehydrogenase Mo-binding subunit